MNDKKLEIKRKLTNIIKQNKMPRDQTDHEAWLKNKALASFQSTLIGVVDLSGQLSNLQNKSLQSDESEKSKLLSSKKALEQRILENLGKLQSFPECPNEFKNDLVGWINGMEDKSKAAPKTYEGWTCGISDEPCDLLLCGTEVENSCQRVDGTANLNKCLLAYICDGKNKLIAIKNKEGSLQARAILRLLVDREGRPALFMEGIYPRIVSKSLKDALVATAMQEANRLGLQLYAVQLPQYIDENSPIATLSSTGGIAPFEYNDASEGLTGSAFTISNARTVVSPKVESQ